MPSAITVSAGTLSAAGLDTRMLDCWQATLALALVAHGVQDVLPVLGAQWWFGPPAVPGGPPLLDPMPEADLLEHRTGLRPLDRPVAPKGLRSQCDRELAAGRLPLVVTDGFVLPWCPYYGVRHIEHSFAVTGTAPDGLLVVDAYDNRTEWGRAEPLDTVATATVVDAIERAPGSRLATLLPTGSSGPADPLAPLRATAGALADWTGSDPYAWFVEECRGADVGEVAFQRFCESCWTIERRRRLFAVWLDTLVRLPGEPLPNGFPDTYRGQVVAAWSEVNRFAYLALRRVRAGRRATLGAVGDLVAAAAAAERASAAELVAWLARDR
ncbi:hypothetical protein [Streptomyces sp. NPDC021020]|uniref:hypothetical protein n=1 Tax=Streptomyces sp. NPDC021020 TaxID=3365109 RepID=UPI003795249D